MATQEGQEDRRGQTRGSRSKKSKILFVSSSPILDSLSGSARDHQVHFHRLCEKKKVSERLGCQSILPGQQAGVFCMREVQGIETLGF